MSNNKQSSIEWLEECLSIHFTHEQKMQFEGLFQQAKAMHKQEMIEFAQEVFRNRYNQVHQSLSHISDDIYNEKYGKNDIDNTAV
jgi:hypothetical protein